jgi:drug/metabolite transporter (DMT)-like permease
MEWWVLALISAAFSAAASIYEKKTLFAEGALEFSSSLAFYNIIFSLPLIYFIDFNSISAISLVVLFFKSILGAIAFLFIMKGLRDLQISSALPLLVLTPGIVAFASFFLFNERLSSYEIAGMIFLLGGTYLLQVERFENFFPFISSFWKGHRYIAGALILYSTTSILDKVLVGKLSMSPYPFILFEHIYFGIIYTIMLLASGGSLKQTPAIFLRSGRLILLVSIFTMIYRFMQIWAVKFGSVALVLSIKRTSVFFAIVIGGRLFKDSNLLVRSIATVIMLIGAILVVMGKN